MKKLVLLLLVSLVIMSCARAVKPVDYGIAKGVFLTIIVPKQQTKAPYLDTANDSFTVNSLTFQSYSKPVYIENKTFEWNHGIKYSKQDDILSFTTGDFDSMMGDDTYKMNFNFDERTSENALKYTLSYINSSAQVVQRFSVKDPFYNNAKEIMNAMVDSIKYITSFEYYSKYKQDSIYANFERLLHVQNGSSKDPITGNIIGSHFQLPAGAGKNTDIYLSFYPYRDGTKVVVGTVIPAEEKNGVVDFIKISGDISNRIDKIIND